MRRLGICYYPELYKTEEQEKLLLEDIALMKNAGISVVRIAEFTWCLMEPAEGQYDFGWLEHIVNTLGENGISSIICTPTAAPPMWMATKYPDILFETNYHKHYHAGGRHFKCNMNPTVLEKTEGICKEIGKHFGKNPYVLGFQIDNELSSELSAKCHCKHCEERFVKWCEKKYQKIDNLNQSWRTLFWGQKYNNFNEIKLPVESIKLNIIPELGSLGWEGTDNPAHRLDYDRFVSESVIAYYEFQKQILEQYTEKPITENTIHFAEHLVDPSQLMRKSKVAGVDHYPGARIEDKNQSSKIYSMTRNFLKKDFWLLETLCGGGHGNWAMQGMPMGTPNTFRQNLAYAFVSGAEVITAFKFLIFEGGFEQLGSALIDIDRVPRRRYQEFVDAYQDLQTYEPILDKTKIQAKVAMILDYDSIWSDEIKPINKKFAYEPYFRSFYGYVENLGVSVDVIEEDQSLEGYDLVIMPFGMIAKPEFEQAVRDYVKKGGHFVSLPLGFAKDENTCGVIGEAMPLHMTDVFGARVGEVEPVFENTVSKFLIDGKEYETLYWQEFLELEGAECYSRVTDTFRANTPIITKNAYGDGDAYYVGTALSKESAQAFFKELFQEYHIEQAPIETPEGINIVTRVNDTEKYYFVFNSKNEPLTLSLFASLKDALTGKPVGPMITVAPKGFSILK